ncbi:MAG: hypothetical protein U5K43_06625 [Halofilum sp. (in: g-proteobacteria)]|nr:hypothetical protein [Halofilum sp. (in: g-proteobacteria)]
MPLALYGLYIFVQYQDTLDHAAEVGHRADIRLVARVGHRLRALARSSSSSASRAWCAPAINFGDIFGTPSFLWGITVVAAGTSIPDAFVSVRAARAGRGVTSIANVLGSNTFDLLVCIPAGVLIAGSAVINFSIAAPMLAVLTAATVVAVPDDAHAHGALAQAESWLLLRCTLAFVLWIGLETFGAVDLVPSLPPASTGAALTRRWPRRSHRDYDHLNPDYACAIGQDLHRPDPRRPRGGCPAETPSPVAGANTEPSTRLDGHHRPSPPRRATANGPRIPWCRLPHRPFLLFIPVGSAAATIPLSCGGPIARDGSPAGRTNATEESL